MGFTPTVTQIAVVNLRSGLWIVSIMLCKEWQCSPLQRIWREPHAKHVLFSPNNSQPQAAALEEDAAVYKDNASNRGT